MLSEYNSDDLSKVHIHSQTNCELISLTTTHALSTLRHTQSFHILPIINTTTHLLLIILLIFCSYLSICQRKHFPHFPMPMPICFIASSVHRSSMSICLHSRCCSFRLCFFLCICYCKPHAVLSPTLGAVGRPVLGLGVLLCVLRLFYVKNDI